MENKVVYAPSRRDEDHVPLHDSGGHLFLISFPSLDWTEDLKASYHEDSHYNHFFMICITKLVASQAFLCKMV